MTTVRVSGTNSTGSESQSTCTSPQPSEADGGYFNQDQLLVFQYFLFIPNIVLETDEKVVSIMEDRIHEGLVQNFLTCNAARGEQSFYVWSISSSPSDTIFSDNCDPDLVASIVETPPDESRCVLVQAELNMEVYFPRVRRNLHLTNITHRILRPAVTTSADPQVMNESREYLDAAMDEGAFSGEEDLRMFFLAFIIEREGHVTIDRGPLTVAGAEGQLMGNRESSRVVGGAMTVAAAAICLIAVAVLALRRRKQRSDAFLSHVDNLSTSSDLNKDELDRDTEIVGELDGGSVGWFGEDCQDRDARNSWSEAECLEYKRDVHKCNSAFCEICLKQKGPTFIKSNYLNVSEILKELRYESSIVEDRSHSTPDTVDL